MATAQARGRVPTGLPRAGGEEEPLAAGPLAQSGRFVRGGGTRVVWECGSVPVTRPPRSCGQSPRASLAGPPDAVSRGTVHPASCSAGLLGGQFRPVCSPHPEGRIPPAPAPPPGLSSCRGRSALNLPGQAPRGRAILSSAQLTLPHLGEKGHDLPGAREGTACPSATSCRLGARIGNEHRDGGVQPTHSAGRTLRSRHTD